MYMCVFVFMYIYICMYANAYMYFIYVTYIDNICMHASLCVPVPE